MKLRRVYQFINLGPSYMRLPLSDEAKPGGGGAFLRFDSRIFASEPPAPAGVDRWCSELRRQRGLVRALQHSEGGEEKAGGEVNGVVAGVKFDEARDNDECGVFSDDCAQEADHEVADSKRDAKLLSDGGPKAHGHTKEDETQDDVVRLCAKLW